MDNPKYELFKGRNDQFYWHLRAENGKIILSSEGYKSRAGAENGIESVRDNSRIEDRFEKLKSKDGQFYFNLKAANHEVIGTSEMYTSVASRDKGIVSVMSNGPDAPLQDNTE